MIVLFSDRFDLGRNVHAYYYPSDERTKLDDFLGPVDWRSKLDGLADQTGAKVRSLFGKLYLEQLSKLGYLHTDTWPLDGPQGPVFSVIYASKNPLGLKFCRIAMKKDFDGNEGLFD